MKRICMWSGPRNVSTALMYAFHHRGDSHVIDEPFYGHYLEHTGIDHPGREEILRHHEQDSDKVIQSLLGEGFDKEILFLKNMPFHMLYVNLGFMDHFDHFFLIREPRAMIASYIKKRPDVKMSDLGLDLQYQMFEDLRSQGKEPAVIDSYTLLQDPRSVLRLLCQKLDIPFSESMLHWEAGPIPQDGIWAKYWYANVHASTGLGAAKEPGLIKIPDHIEALARECSTYYNEFKQFELKP